MSGSRVYRVGVVGMGFGARVHVPALMAHDRFSVQAVCGIRADSAASVANAVGARAVTDWRDLVADPDLDLVTVATAPQLHAPVTLGALAGGKHVLCEKPTAMDAVEAGQMAEGARMADRVVAIAHEFRYQPARLAVRRLVAESAIGDVLTVTMISSGSGLSTRPITWWERAETGGGMLGAGASHYVDNMQWWIADQPTDVTAILRSLSPDHPASGGGTERATADDAFTVLIGFAGGALGVMVAGGGGAGFGTCWDLIGTKGAIRMEGDRTVLLKRAGAKEAEPIALDADRAVPPVGGTDARVPPFLGLLDRLADRLDGGAPTPDLAEIGQGLMVQRVLDGARQSYATGSRIRILPAAR